MQRCDPWPLNPRGELLLGVKIESPEGVAACESILSVPGIGFAEMGPGDLGLSLGYLNVPRDPYPPEMKEARERVFAACRKNRIAFLEVCSPANIVARLGEGVRVVAGTGAILQRSAAPTRSVSCRFSSRPFGCKGTLTARERRCGQALGLADDGDDQILRLEQALGGALGVVERHRLDLGVALVDVVEAEVLLPEPQKLVGDLGVAVEAQRKGARQVVLGVLQLLLGRARRWRCASARRGSRRATGRSARSWWRRRPRIPSAACRAGYWCGRNRRGRASRAPPPTAART